MKNDERELISITEYSRLRGVSTETLRHYDRIGLFKPAWVDPQSGMRYYSLLFEKEKLGTIMELKQLGMSLSEIREFLDGRNLKKSLDILKKIQNELKEKIRDLESKNKVLCERIDSIEAYLNEDFNFDEIKVKNVERRAALISEKYYKDNEEALINREAIIIETHMMDIAPLIGGERFALILPVASMENADPSFKVALMVDKLMYNDFAVSYIESGTYACKMRYGDSLNIMDDYEAIKSFCEKNDYEMYGEAVEILTVDMSITDVPEENVYELQIPVRERRRTK